MSEMMKDGGTVLCAVDDSSHATAVLYTGAGLAQHLGARLVILRVDARAEGDHDDAARAHAELNEFVIQTVPGNVGYRAATDVVLRAGTPASTILSVARELDASLIVMGTRARNRVGRALLGSTAQRVMQDTTVPVAVVPRSDTEVVTVAEHRAVAHFGVIVVGLDLESPEEGPVRLASRLARGAAARTVLVYVAPQDADPWPLLARLTALQTTAGGGTRARAIVQKGPVVGAMVWRVKREHAGIVVLGRDPADAGAVACEILRQTGVVVVVVPEDRVALARGR